MFRPFAPLSRRPVVTPEQAFGQAVTDLADPHHVLAYNGQPIQIVDSLSGGGTKKVYDAILGDERVALALPNRNNHQGGPEGLHARWQAALREPANTADLRSRGFAVNSRCDAVPITVNSSHLTALAMHRYTDLPFAVRDSKNAQSSDFSQPLFRGPLTAEAITNSMERVGVELGALLREQIYVGRDSINLRQDPEGLGLFLNDLDDVQYDTDERNLPNYPRNYAYYAVLALREAVSPAEEQWVTPHTSIMRYDQRHPLTDSLAAIITRNMA